MLIYIQNKLKGKLVSNSRLDQKGRYWILSLQKVYCVLNFQASAIIIAEKFFMKICYGLTDRPKHKGKTIYPSFPGGLNIKETVS